MKAIIDFIKDDPKEAIGGLIAWGSLPILLFMLSVIGA